MKCVIVASTFLRQGLFVLLTILTFGESDLIGQEFKIIQIPEDFNSIKFSLDGNRLAFVEDTEMGCRAVVDGKPGKSYESLTVVEFSTKGDQYFYGAKREGKWFLVRNGAEIAELGDLTNLNQATGLHFFGIPQSVTVSYNLPIWFAEKAPNYFVLCYKDSKGRIFKDGAWLSVEFTSFWHEAMSLSPDGKHYSYAISPVGSRGCKMYIDGVAGEEYEGIDGAFYMEPGSRLVYRVKRDGIWLLMEGDKLLTDIGILENNLKVSADRSHIAILSKKPGNNCAVIVDGREEGPFPKVDWGYSGFLSSSSGSFTWNKDFTSHAYITHKSREANSPMMIIFNGKPFFSSAEIRSSSLSISDDGLHLAYVTKSNDKWDVVVDSIVHGSYEDVGDPIFVGTGNDVVYSAKLPEGWILEGISDSQVFLDIGPLYHAPGNRVAYAAKVKNDKWRVFINSAPVSREYDGIVSQTGIKSESTGSIRFVARDGGNLIWTRAK